MTRSARFSFSNSIRPRTASSQRDRALVRHAGSGSRPRPRTPCPRRRAARASSAHLVHPVELERDRPVPVDPEPAQRLLDLLDRLGDLAARVGVLDPQAALAAVLPREQPVEEERAHAADVEEAGRARGHADADAHRAYRTSAMQFGAHVSSAGGIDTAIDRVEAIGGDCVQVFTQSPRMWRPTAHKPEAIERFKARRAEAGIGGVVCHALYLCNLAAPDDDVYEQVGRGDVRDGRRGGRDRGRRRHLPRRLAPRRRLRRRAASGSSRRCEQILARCERRHVAR